MYDFEAVLCIDLPVRCVRNDGLTLQFDKMQAVWRVSTKCAEVDDTISLAHFILQQGVGKEPESYPICQFLKGKCSDMEALADKGHRQGLQR